MKLNLFALCAVLACASSVAFCASAKPARANETERTSIRRQFERWVNAYEHGDAQTVTSIYAPDAILLLPNSKPIRGRKQLRRFFDKLCRQKVTYTYKINQVVVTGDWAFRWGSAQVIWKRIVAGKRLGDATGHLKFIDIWKKGDDGVWRIYRDSSVIDSPAHAKRRAQD